jgi:hypothetical protein
MVNRKFEHNPKFGKYDPSEKLNDHLNERLVVTGFETKYIESVGADLIIMETDEGKMTTYSQVVAKQLEEEKEKGFPIEVKFARVKNYITMIEP